MAPIGYSGSRGKLIREKNLKSKILSQTPFKTIKKISTLSLNPAAMAKHLPSPVAYTLVSIGVKICAK
jgi:hypothetical protein